MSRLKIVVCSKWSHNYLQVVNNKGADQTVQSGLRLCCSHATQSKFLAVGPHINVNVCQRVQLSVLTNEFKIGKHSR